MIKILPVFIFFLALPLLATGLILLVRRTKSTANLAMGFILSGITGSIFTAFIIFSSSTVPIFPYETSDHAWYPILGQLLLSLYIGFGLGVAIASLAVSLFWLIKMARKYFVVLFIATVMMSSCSPPVAPTQLTMPTKPPANVTCNEISFYLDPALGDGYKCETVPENSSSDIPMDVFIYPAHTELTIQNYPLTRTQFPPQIWIYPVDRFSELIPDVLPNRVSGLKRLISSGTWSGRELPFLPPLPMAQTFFSHETVLSFNGGQGVRFITEYSEGPLPISNLNIIYTFQGLTNDERYWVAVTLPISNPILPADPETLPEGYTQESLILNYSSYVSDVKGMLDAQAPGSFLPTINSLDSLVESITF